MVSILVKHDGDMFSLLNPNGSGGIDEDHFKQYQW